MEHGPTFAPRRIYSQHSPFSHSSNDGYPRPQMPDVSIHLAKLQCKAYIQSTAWLGRIHLRRLFHQARGHPCQTPEDPDSPDRETPGWSPMSHAHSLRHTTQHDTDFAPSCSCHSCFLQGQPSGQKAQPGPCARLFSLALIINNNTLHFSAAFHLRISKCSANIN